MKELVGRLERCQQISTLSNQAHNEAWVLAQSLSDIAHSSEAYLKLLPTLLDDKPEGSELVQRLIDIVNELQHMAYHLEEPRFIRKFLEPLRGDWDKAGGASYRDLYVLQHSYDVKGRDETKLIGVYRSQELAEEAIARLRQQPGFRDHPADFHVDCYTADEDHWTEGFASG